MEAGRQGRVGRDVRPAGGGGGGGELLVRQDAVDRHYEGVSDRGGEVYLRVRKRSFELDRSVVVVLNWNVEHGSGQTLDCVGGGERRDLTVTASSTEIFSMLIV